MNNIKFNKPLYLNKQYVVYLDSDNRFVFKNRRHAEDFIRKISRESDKTVLLITEKLNDLESFYRFYSLSDKDYRFKHLVKNSIDFINNRLTWIGEHSGSVNHDAITFNALINCINELTTAFALVEEKAVERRDTITKKRCSLKIDILKMYQDNLLKIDIKPDRLRIKKAK